MNILEAIAAMRAGNKVRRRCHIATTVGKSWLSLAMDFPEDFYQPEEMGDDEAEKHKIEVIFFECEAITEAHDWVGCYPAVCNPWKPQQADLFASDFEVLS